MNSDAKLRLEPYHPDQHYRVIAQWWKAHGNEPMPRDCFPDTGVVVTRDALHFSDRYIDGKNEVREPIAASFCFLSNSRIGYVDFTVCAPETAALLSLKAARMAIDGATDIARKAGCKLVWTTTANAAIKRIYQRAGFVPTAPQQHFFLLLDSGMSPDMLSD